MIHTGLGEQHVNGILGQLNIPIVSHSMLDARQKEVGEVMEDIAQESMKEWREKEIEMTKQLDGNENITVSVDAGWQKRGSGRTYDSLTGHCSMIGTKTGKILNVQVRSTTCRICSRAKSRGLVPRDHICRKNFAGSAKSMEPDMVVDMVAQARKEGMNIETIVGDDDTTTIARLRSKVDSSIKKRSDRNHVRKLFGNSLYSLKKDHSSLSTKVICYLQKCFNYLVAQGKGNTEKIKESLPSISQHPFGDHSNCNKEWCRFIENSGMKYNSLPYGKPLSDKSLQTALQKILQAFANNAEKLAYLESTQSNESFNKSVASKAPKSRHYGGSSSLHYRIAATVAQKNKGHKYLIDVNAKAGLSPGFYTKRLCLLRDMAARKRKAVAITRKAKLRRIELKSIRHQKTTSCEVREGTCYKTGTDLREVLVNEEIYTAEIPAPRLPSSIIVQKMPSIDNITEIYMDLEATGLARTSHILQLSVKRGTEEFSSYVIPGIEITQKASEITGLTFQNRSLFCNGEVVPAVNIKSCLDDFLAFVEKTKNNVIFGHNILNYDCLLLFNALEKCGMVNRFMSCVLGFVDTLKLFKRTHPGLSSYSQSKLCEYLINETYNAHNAIFDVSALSKLVSETNVRDRAIIDAYFSVYHVHEKYEISKETKRNLPSMKCLINCKAISSRTANTIAASGLAYCHLKLAFERNGRKGLEDLLGEQIGQNKVRVTRSKKIINNICDFFVKPVNSN